MRLKKGFPELSPESISYIGLEPWFKTFVTNEVFLHVTLGFFVTEDIPCGPLTPAKLIWRDISVLALQFSPNEEIRISPRVLKPLDRRYHLLTEKSQRSISLFDL